MFGVVAADPPWKFDDQLPGDTRGADNHYDTMTIPEICALPVRDVIDRDCALLLWVPSAIIRDGIAVAHAWGFTEKQTWIWVKTKKGVPVTAAGDLDLEKLIPKLKDGTITEDQLAFLMGRYGRNCHEIALLCTRGRVIPHVHDKTIRTVFFAPVTRHSEKPECFQDALEKMFPDLRKLELFARRKRPQWACVGNEAPATLGEDIRESLKNLVEILAARAA